MQYDPLGAETLTEECQHASHSAAGPDGMEPAEMAMLPDSTFAANTNLLNDIEQGAKWPAGMSNAKAAFMQRDDNSPDDLEQSGCT